MSPTQTIAALFTIASFAGCGAKDSTRACAPTNTWSQPAWSCGEGAPKPIVEEEPEPIVEVPEEAPPEPVVAKAVLRADKIEILEKVQFETNSADIREESFALLDEVAGILVENPNVTKVRVEGHTDSVGGKRSNQRLSQKRAEAVRDYLVDKGVVKKRLEAKGFGLTKPIADNKSDDGRAANRRVEFNILAGGPGVKSRP